MVWPTKDMGQYSIHFSRSHMSLLRPVVSGWGSLTHQHPPQLPFSSPPCPLSFFLLGVPGFHLLHLPYALPGIWKGRRETKGALVGNGMDCQLHGSEERWSPVLQRNGIKRVKAWDSCVDPPGTPSCLFLPHHQQLLPNPNMTHLDEMSGLVLKLGYEAGLKFPKGEGEWETDLMRALLSYFPCSLLTVFFSVLPVNTLSGKKTCVILSAQEETTPREKPVH